MIKKIILIIILIQSFLFSKDLYLENEKIAEIDTFETLKEGYLKAKVTKPFFMFLMLGKEYAVLTQSIPKNKNEGIFYKKDKNNLISVLNYILNEDWIEEKNYGLKNGDLKIKCNKEELKCNFQYFNKEEGLQNEGYILMADNREVKEFKEFKKNIVLK